MNVALAIEVPGVASELDEQWFSRIAGTALEAERPGERWLVDILVCNDEVMRGLNQEYRGVDAPTDVLSFNLAEGEAFPAIENAPTTLGQLIVSYPTAERE